MVYRIFPPDTIHANLSLMQPLSILARYLLHQLGRSRFYYRMGPSLYLDLLS